MTEIDREWDRLPIAELRQLDAVCDRFEQALSHDPNTRIESFVAELSAPQQRLVVRELVQLEIEHRQAHGQQSVADEYAERFPAWADELRALAAQCIHELSPAADAGCDTMHEQTADNDTKTTAAQRPDPSPSAGEGAEENQLAVNWDADLRAALWGRSWSDLPADGVLGHYRLQSVIARGGMGIVVRAHDTRLGRDVAIKIPAPGITHDARANERFLRESRAVALVRHSHVVTIHAVEEVNDIPFLVMELVEGPTLEEHLRTSGKLPAREVVLLARQMAQGLAAAHKQGLIHRDVKPANILLEKNNQLAARLPDQSAWVVKLTDFGLARVAAEAGLTNSGLIAGTPQYMSPEQAQGQELDARSDLFSLGSVMYAMCAGAAPFDADSALAIVRQVADTPARPLREVAPETPEWLIDVIDKLMAKAPDDRLQSAAEVVELLGGDPHDLRTDRFAADSAVDTPTTVAAVLLGRRIVMLTALALIGIAVVAFGIAQSVRNNRPPEVADVRTPPVVESAEVAATPPNVEQSWQGWPASAPAPVSAPFDAEQVTALQTAWANYLRVEVETINSIGMRFRVIPPGEFLMGNSEKELADLLAEAEKRSLSAWIITRIPLEGPQHHVTLTKPFGMGVHEVTRGQFRQFVENAQYETDAEKDGQGGYGWKGKWVQASEFLWNTSLGFENEQTDDEPVVNVSWNDAQAFCQWLSEQEGVTYRLPTEAEWEYACRAGSITRYSYGEDEPLLQDHAWTLENSGRNTHRVGLKTANAWGLRDMYGNAFEWCQDEYYGLYSETPAVDPTRSRSAAPNVGADVAVFDRVLRGGSFSHPASSIRSTFRRSNHPSFRNATTGFRVVRVCDAPSNADES